MPKRHADDAQAAACDWTAAVGRRLGWVVEILQDHRPGLSQSALAREFNADQSTWNKYLQGTRMPSLASMTKFCDAYGITLDFIYRGRMHAEMAQWLALHLAARHPELVQGAAPAAEPVVRPRVKQEA